MSRGKRAELRQNVGCRRCQQSKLLATAVNLLASCSYGIRVSTMPTIPYSGLYSLSPSLFTLPPHFLRQSKEMLEL
jgi:ribosomal protein L37E